MDAFVPEVAPPPLLECRDLTKRYGATVALDRFTVSLPAGRIVGLLGPNGQDHAAEDDRRRGPSHGGRHSRGGL